MRSTVCYEQGGGARVLHTHEIVLHQQSSDRAWRELAHTRPSRERLQTRILLHEGAAARRRASLHRIAPAHMVKSAKNALLRRGSGSTDEPQAGRRNRSEQAYVRGGRAHAQPRPGSRLQQLSRRRTAAAGEQQPQRWSRRTAWAAHGGSRRAAAAATIEAHAMGGARRRQASSSCSSDRITRQRRCRAAAGEQQPRQRSRHTPAAVQGGGR